MEPKERERLKKWIILMLILLVLVVLVGLRLNRITVKGNSRYTAEEVEELVFPGFWDKNTVFCMIKDHVKPHAELPFVEDYDIQLTGLFSCDLVVYEKDVVGYVRFMSSNMYFDKDGVIVESAKERLPGVPEVSGLSFGHIVLNRPLPVEDEGLFGEIMNLTQQLDHYGIGCDRIRFDASGNVRLSLSGGQIDVELGQAKEMETKISALNDMLPQLTGLSGTLDLSQFSDGSDRKNTIFKKRT